MKRKLATFKQEYTLNSLDIEIFSKVLEEKLVQAGVERENRIRIRLSLEEALLRMRDRFGETGVVQLSVLLHFGRPILQVSLEGERFNPLSKREVEIEDWSGSLLTAVGLYPQYSYSRGRNILRLNLPTHRMNPALKLLIAIILGTVFGTLFVHLLSPEQQAVLLEDVLQPLYDLWVRILSLISGPVIFLMVINIFLNTGGIEEEGGNSKRVVVRYFMYSAVAALMAGLVACAATGNLQDAVRMSSIDAAPFFTGLLSIVPDNLILPLMEANTAQILLLAFLIGNALLIEGDRERGLIPMFRQLNSIGLLLADWVSLCVPYFTAALVCYEILQGQARFFGWLWIVVLLAFVLSQIYLFIISFSIARRERMSFQDLVKKLWPAFSKAMRVGGLDEGFGEMQSSCVKDLGIERHYAEKSLPMGMTLYMPINIIGAIIFTVFAAAKTGVVISTGWMITAIILIVVMFAAAPPVPGASLLTYMMLLVKLSIPSSTLIAAMVFDILFGIFAGAGNQALLQLDLIMQAESIGLLDKERLRNVPKEWKTAK